MLRRRFAVAGVVVSFLFGFVSWTHDDLLARQGNSPEQREVLALDLDGNGLCLASTGQGVMFKFDPREPAMRTAWMCGKGVDPFLAVDVTKNGRIDGGWELLGGLLGPRNALEYLRRIDGDRVPLAADGRIDAHDSIFRSLILWTDTNHNGISEEAELQSAAYAGINSISLAEEKLSQAERAQPAIAQKVRIAMTLNGRPASRPAFTVRLPSGSASRTGAVR